MCWWYIIFLFKSHRFLCSNIIIYYSRLFVIQVFISSKFCVPNFSSQGSLKISKSLVSIFNLFYLRNLITLVCKEKERERERQVESKTHQISRSGQTRDIFWSNKFHVDWSINFTIPEMTSNSVDLSWCQRKCSYKIFKW